MELGTAHHPDHPYRDPRVVAYVDDARSFLEKSAGGYDLILFGTLDSHRLFSHMGSVRMDSFVYTRESLERARHLLADDGMLVITFVAHRDWIKDRFYRTLTEVFGSQPLAFEWEGQWVTLVVAKDGRQQRAQVGGAYPTLVPRDPEAGVLLTDDWPYLYILGKWIPVEYRGMLLAVLVLSSALIYLAVPRPRGFSGHFFALGAGFLLLETKSVTEFALLYGSTWLVNAVVFTAILVVILLANFAVLRWRFARVGPVYALLVASLLFNYFFDLRRILALTRLGELLAGSFLIALPIFFAAIIFAQTFAATGNLAGALGSNLLGAVFGGLLEYSSLILGLKALYLLAVAVYLTSLLFLRWRGAPAGTAGGA
jgi:hypothetical protein